MDPRLLQLILPIVAALGDSIRAHTFGDIDRARAHLSRAEEAFGTAVDELRNATAAAIGPEQAPTPAVVAYAPPPPPPPPAPLPGAVPGLPTQYTGPTGYVPAPAPPPGPGDQVAGLVTAGPVAVNTNPPSPADQGFGAPPPPMIPAPPPPPPPPPQAPPAWAGFGQR
jgi:hypothetical protein